MSKMPSLLHLERSLRMALLLPVLLAALLWSAFALPARGQEPAPDPMSDSMEFTFDPTGTGVLTVESPIDAGMPVITIDGAVPPLQEAGPPPKVQILIVTDIAVEHRFPRDNVSSIGSNLGNALLAKADLARDNAPGPAFDLSVAFAGAQGTDSACRLLIPWTGDNTATVTLVNDLIGNRIDVLSAELAQAAVPVEDDLASSCLGEFDPNADVKIMLFVGDGAYYGASQNANVREAAIGSSIAIYPVLIKGTADVQVSARLSSLATIDGFALPTLDTSGDMTRLMDQVFGASWIERSWQTQIPNAEPGRAYTVQALFPDERQYQQIYEIAGGQAADPSLSIAEPSYTFTLGAADAFQIRFMLDASGAEIVSSGCRIENSNGLSLSGQMGDTNPLCEFTAAQMDDLLPGTYSAIVQANTRTGQPVSADTVVTVLPRPLTLWEMIREWLREGVGILVLIFTAVLIFTIFDYRRYRKQKTSVTGLIIKSLTGGTGGDPKPPPPTTGHAQLVRLVGSDDLPATMVLMEDETPIGRRRDTSILVLDDPTVADRQCSIVRKQNGYSLIPISDELPTFLGHANDLVQAARINQEYDLKDGDHIGFGSLNIIYRFAVGQLRAAPQPGTPSAVPEQSSALAPNGILGVLKLVESEGPAPVRIEVRKDVTQFGHMTGEGNDVMFSQPEVSGIHCRLERTLGGAFELVQVGTSNPSFVAALDDRGKLYHKQELTSKSAPARLEPGAIFGVFDIAYYQIDYTLPPVSAAKVADNAPARSRIRSSKRGGASSGSGQ